MRKIAYEGTPELTELLGNYSRRELIALSEELGYHPVSLYEIRRRGTYPRVLAIAIATTLGRNVDDLFTPVREASIA